MTGPLDGRVAVITGGTQGLGEAVARRFAARGAAGIVVTGRNAERGEAVARDISGGGCPAVFHQVELGDPAQVASVVPAADEAFGSVHVLVNSAALTDRGTISDTSVELWDRLMAVNVRAPFQLMQASIAVMRRDGVAGSIVNIGSVAAHGGQPWLLPYSTSKAALVALSKSTAYSVMRDRIRVNVLNLGWMDTPGEDSIQRRYHGATDGWLERAEADRPFGRLLKTDEVARSVEFLASDESGMMTGAVLDLDQSVPGSGDAAVPGPDEVG